MLFCWFVERVLFLITDPLFIIFKPWRDRAVKLGYSTYFPIRFIIAAVRLIVLHAVLAYSALLLAYTLDGAIANLTKLFTALVILFFFFAGIYVAHCTILLLPDVLYNVMWDYEYRHDDHKMLYGTEEEINERIITNWEIIGHNLFRFAILFYIHMVSMILPFVCAYLMFLLLVP